MFACLQVCLLGGEMGRLEDQSMPKGPSAERTGKHTCSSSLPLLLQALVLSQQLLDMKNKRQFILHHLSCRKGRNKDEVCRAGLKSSLSNSLQWWGPTYFSVWRGEGWGGRFRGINRLEVASSLTDSCTELELLLLLAGWLRIRHQNFPWLK